MSDVCRHCGRPVIRGRYLAWTHSNGIPRSSRPHYASPVRPTSRSAAVVSGTRQSTEASDASATRVVPPRRGPRPVPAGAGHSPG